MRVRTTCYQPFAAYSLRPTAYRLSASSLFRVLDESLDLAQRRDAYRADLAQAERGNGIGEAGGIDGGHGAVGCLDEKSGREHVAGASQILGADLVSRQLGVTAGEDDAGAIFAARDHRQTARADMVDRVTRERNLFFADDDAVDPAQQLRCNPQVVQLHLAAGALPFAHPALRGDA